MAINAKKEDIVKIENHYTKKIRLGYLQYFKCDLMNVFCVKCNVVAGQQVLTVTVRLIVEHRRISKFVMYDVKVGGKCVDLETTSGLA